MKVNYWSWKYCTSPLENKTSFISAERSEIYCIAHILFGTAIHLWWVCSQQSFSPLWGSTIAPVSAQPSWCVPLLSVAGEANSVNDIFINVGKENNKMRMLAVPDLQNDGITSSLNMSLCLSLDYLSHSNLKNSFEKFLGDSVTIVQISFE